MSFIKRNYSLIIKAAFLAYCAFLIYVLFFNGRRNVHGYSFGDYIAYNVNLVPFKYLMGYCRNFIHGERIGEFVINFIGNATVFIPLGVMIPFVIKQFKSFKRFLILSVLLPLAVESIQLVAMVGCFDIDDIILNSLGLCVGYGAYKLLYKWLGK